MNASQINWDPGQEHHHSNPFMTVHRLLRGRYLWVIGLGLLFGVVGGTMGFLSKQPQYKSTGMVRIQPSLPKVLYESEQSTAPKMFTSFVNSQAQLISDPNVVQNALVSDEWKAVSNTGSSVSLDDIIRGLDIRPDRRAQEIIRVSFEDVDPVISQTIVNAVLDAYIEKYGKEGSIKNPEIVTALNARKDDLGRQRDQIDNQIADIAGDYQTENLEPLIQNAMLVTRQLQDQRRKLDQQLGLYAQLRSRQESGEAESMTPEEAANIDPMLAGLLDQKQKLENNREQMMASEGLRAEHRDVRRITLMIDNIQTRIDERMQALESGEGSALFVDENGKPLPSESVLQYRLELLDDQISKAKENADKLFSASLSLDSLRGDRANIQKSLAEVNSRLDMIETESLVEDMKEITGKISIAARATKAKEPTSDARFKMAAVGFVGLGSIPAMAILALGYFSHRIQYSDDDIISGSKAGIIGMLPDLGNALNDQELASASAFAVHQIRSQLQIKNANSETRIYGVTSPAPGDGKTSMIIALGLSFAESGNRTLLVDLDFIGRGLSVHFGYPDAPSLADALCDETKLDQQIRDTEFPGLQILPAGFGDDELVSRLAPRTVQSLLEFLRGRYDTILIDTGPILGSVEAAFVSPQADGMLLVVGRGQYKPLVKKAIEQIQAIDGKIAATVFNRASIQEIRHSASSMSVHFSRQFSRQQQQVDLQGGMRVGPVAGTLFRQKDNADPIPFKRAEP